MAPIGVLPGSTVARTTNGPTKVLRLVFYRTWHNNGKCIMIMWWWLHTLKTQALYISLYRYKTIDQWRDLERQCDMFTYVQINIDFHVWSWEKNSLIIMLVHFTHLNCMLHGVSKFPKNENKRVRHWKNRTISIGVTSKMFSGGTDESS